MERLRDEITEFLHAVWESWVSLMSGVLGVVMWVLGAALEPAPVSLRWTFLACGTFALIVSAFAVWRKTYREARPYEKETYEHARWVFEGLPEETKGLLEQMVVRKCTITEVEARTSGLGGTGFLAQNDQDYYFGCCRLNQDYERIISRLVRGWRQSKVAGQPRFDWKEWAAKVVAPVRDIWERAKRINEQRKTRKR